MHDGGGWERWHSCFDRRREINLFTTRCKANEFSISRPPSTEINVSQKWNALQRSRETYWHHMGWVTWVISNCCKGSKLGNPVRSPGKHTSRALPLPPLGFLTMFYRRTYNFCQPPTTRPENPSRCLLVGVVKGTARLCCANAALFFSHPVHYISSSTSIQQGSGELSVIPRISRAFSQRALQPVPRASFLD